MGKASRKFEACDIYDVQQKLGKLNLGDVDYELWIFGLNLAEDRNLMLLRILNFFSVNRERFGIQEIQGKCGIERERIEKGKG